MIYLQSARASLVGMTIHGAYLGGCFYGVKQGMPAGITALICSLQPVLVSVFSSIFFQEKLSPRKWLGLGLGLAGLILVIAPKLEGSGDQVLPTAGVIAVFIALLGGTSGTLLQKKFGSGVEVLSGTSWQYVATGILMGSLAFIFEGDQSIAWNASFIFSLTWLIVATFNRCDSDSLLLTRPIECIICFIFVLLSPSGDSSRGLLPLWRKDRPRYCCGYSSDNRWRGTCGETGESARSHQPLVVFDLLEICNRWLCNLFSVSYRKALAQL